MVQCTRKDHVAECGEAFQMPKAMLIDCMYSGPPGSLALPASASFREPNIYEAQGEKSATERGTERS